MREDQGLLQMRINIRSVAGIALALLTVAFPTNGQNLPDVTTQSPTNALAVEAILDATLQGEVNPNGAETVAWFEWGLRRQFPNTTPPVNVGNSNGTATVSATLSNLTAGFVYRYRVVASNSFGVVKGRDRICWAAAFTGASTVTNECHVPFVDSTKAFALPQAIACGQWHGTVLKADGTLASIGTNWVSSDPIPAGATNVVSIAAAADYNLALKENGQVIGWGFSGFGTLNIPAAATNVTMLAAGYEYSFALRTDGTLMTWNYDGVSFTGFPAAATNVMAIAAGYSDTCLALRQDGTLVQWQDEFVLDVPADATNIVAISGQGMHALALRGDGSVVGWGANFAGQTDTPTSATNIVDIAAGEAHNLALKADGTIIAWGAGASDPDMFPDYGQSIVPPEATNIIGIAAGPYHSLAIRADGKIFAWGQLSEAPIPASINDLVLPISVSGAVNVDVEGTYPLVHRMTNNIGAVSVRTQSVIVIPARLVAQLQPLTDAIDETATLHALVNPNNAGSVAWFEWGRTLRFGHSTSPVAVGNGTNLVPVQATLTNLTPGLPYYYCAVISNSYWTIRSDARPLWTPRLVLDGSPFQTNECNTPMAAPSAIPHAAPTLLAAGEWQSFAVRPDGTVVGWGFNENGEADVPAGATNIVALVANDDVAMGLRGNGTVVGWSITIPVTIPEGITNVVAIALGQDNQLALQADGTVLGWGSSYGQAIPPSATNVIAIAAGYSHAIAARRDGRVIGWGMVGLGQEEDNIPPNATNVIAVAAGFDLSVALKANGEVIAWDNIDPPPSSATNVVAIAAGTVHALALKADGTVVSWGGISTPVPSEATNVIAIAAGGPSSWAIREDGEIIGWGPNVSGELTVPANLQHLSLSVSSNSFLSTNAPGTHQVSYTCTNALGAAGSATRSIVVTDAIPPVVTLLGANPLMVQAGGTFSDPGAAALDLCAGDLTTNLVVSGSVNTNLPGTYLVTYSAMDDAGNIGVTNRNVLVVTRPSLAASTQSGTGTFQLSFTNTPGALFHVLASTNAALPLDSWAYLGPVIENPAGQFHFTDSYATNRQRYYRVQSQ